MALGLIVKTGRILTAKSFFGQAVGGITHCAIGDGDASFTDPQNPPAPDISQTLPNNVTECRVIPIYKFDRESGDITPKVQEKSNLYLRDLLGTLLGGSRITVSLITEKQLSFAAAERLNFLIQNLDECTFDQAGSYLVRGFDTFIGGIDDDSVEAITNAGCAYIQGFWHQRDLPPRPWYPNPSPPGRCWRAEDL